MYDFVVEQYDEDDDKVENDDDDTTPTVVVTTNIPTRASTAKVPIRKDRFMLFVHYVL